MTKFAYLKELVEPKVRADIDGLPLNTKGYERAKIIIKDEYGKTSEIVNAYVNNILQLPNVTSADPNRVNSFYKTLLFNVQSLETLGKIERVNGMTKSVLDKFRNQSRFGQGSRKLARLGFTSFGPGNEEMERCKPSD